MTTEIKNRSDEELNRTIAEWMGARYFTEDLNACHEAEMKWDEQHPEAYVKRTEVLYGIHRERQHARWHMTSACSRERAEALVAVIESSTK